MYLLYNTRRIERWDGPACAVFQSSTLCGCPCWAGAGLPSVIVTAPAFLPPPPSCLPRPRRLLEGASAAQTQALSTSPVPASLLCSALPARPCPARELLRIPCVVCVLPSCHPSSTRLWLPPSPSSVRIRHLACSRSLSRSRALRGTSHGHLWQPLPCSDWPAHEAPFQPMLILAPNTYPWTLRIPMRSSSRVSFWLHLVRNPVQFHTTQSNISPSAPTAAVEQPRRAQSLVVRVSAQSLTRQ